jgi:hypothetical protein
MEAPLIAPEGRRAHIWWRPRLLGELLLVAVAVACASAALSMRGAPRAPPAGAAGVCIAPECMHALGGGQLHG